MTLIVRLYENNVALLTSHNLMPSCLARPISLMGFHSSEVDCFLSERCWFYRNSPKQKLREICGYLQKWLMV